MKVVWIIASVLIGGFAFIMIVGSMLPETEASKARASCDNLERIAYTNAEKAQAAEVCAVLRKEADKRMGRIPRDAP